MTRKQPVAAVALLLTVALAAEYGSAQEPPQEAMSFFITSRGPGSGADLGGLPGADAHCQALAEAVGAGDRTWRAYLSTASQPGTGTVHARDRIGEGPWYNARGVQVAASVSAAPRLTSQTATSSTPGWAASSRACSDPRMPHPITSARGFV